MSLERCLRDIANEGALLAYAALIELSDLSASELGRFERVWTNVPTPRRLKVIERLVEMGEENPQFDFCAVFKLAARDPHETVQEKAISGFWEFEDRSIIPLLLDILGSDTYCQVRASAATALGKFACLAQDGKILSKDAQTVQDALMAVLQNEENPLDVRRRALEAVSPFNTPRIQEYVRWAFHSDDQSLKCSSLYAMGKTQDRSWLPAIIAALKGGSSPLRFEAASACGELVEEETVPHLIPLLEDEDLEVQLAAAASIGKIGGTLAKRVLLRCVRTGDPAVKDAAQEALEEMEA